MAIGQELLNVPMGDMIRQMATAIADAQVQLDGSSIEVAEMMGGLKLITDDSGEPIFDDSRIFFGFETMPFEDAVASIDADDALTGGDKDALKSSFKDSAGNNPPPGTLVRVPTRMSMLELGFSPTFYQFVDTIIEVKIAIKITRETQASTTRRDSQTRNLTASQGGGLFRRLFGGSSANQSTVSTSQVDATYASKYGYSAEGASLLRTKLVPIPPPPVLEERIRRQLDQETERRRRAAGGTG